MCMIEDAGACGAWLTHPGEVKARKAHRCEQCYRTIEAGETYTSGAWVERGEGICPTKVCAQCMAAARWLTVVCGGFLYGQDAISEDLAQHHREEPDLRSLGLARIVRYQNRRWLRRGELVPVDAVNGWVDDALSRVPEMAKS